jgi:hypothetical protein
MDSTSPLEVLTIDSNDGISNTLVASTLLQSPGRSFLLEVRKMLNRHEALLNRSGSLKGLKIRTAPVDCRAFAQHFLNDASVSV